MSCARCDWTGWIASNLALLELGRVLVPRELAHPSLAGFRRVVGLPQGQRRDWATPHGAGRVHVHEYDGGQLVAHLDRYDPDRGTGAAVLHFLRDVLKVQRGRTHHL